MMLRKLILPLALAVACPLALADAAAPFIGKWNAQWQTDKQSYEAVMEITETGGTWKTATMSRNNACFGRQVPIQHDRATSDSLDMTLKFSDVITGCNNATVKLRLDDKGNVIGTRSGYPLQLKRE
ncbi:MAG: hypothetical protein KF720_13955 [Rubrivivax sp.]|nr:hypothetical protein [Rubrivivax sp.]